MSFLLNPFAFAAASGEAVATANGLATASAAGASLFSAVGSASGQATVAGVGEEPGSVAAASGTSAVSGVGAAFANATASASGTGAASGAGASIANATASAAGTSTVSGVPGTGTLNPSDKSADITLSNGNLKATKTTGGVGWVSVRSQTSHSSGKYYYEWTLNEFSGSFIGAGFANSTASLSNYQGSDANGISIVTDGNVYKNGSGTATLAAMAEGNIIGLAIDLDNDLFWCRNGAGNWNGSGTANPATGTGGISLPSGLTSGSVYAGLSVQVSPNDAGTANFGATAFNQTAPSGFSAWG